MSDPSWEDLKAFRRLRHFEGIESTLDHTKTFVNLDGEIDNNRIFIFILMIVIAKSWCKGMLIAPKSTRMGDFRWLVSDEKLTRY